MIDAGDAIRDHLLANTALYALVGTRVYAERDVPPPGYQPVTDGACVCVKARGGVPNYTDALLEPSVQAKCYGTDETTANAVYRALYGALHNSGSGVVRWSQCEVLGQTLTERDTGWPFVLSFHKLWIDNT